MLNQSPVFIPDNQKHLLGPKNNDEKTGYDEDLDEEDSKTNLTTKKNKKSKKSKKKTKLLGDDDTSEVVTDQVTANKSRKPKDDPRLDFVNEYFKQNLNPGTLNPNQASASKRDLSSSKIREPHKNSFMNEWQNDILRNLQDNNKVRKSKDLSTNQKDKDKQGAQGKDTQGATDTANTSGIDPHQNSDSSSIKMNLESDTGSVTSDSKALIRHLRLLRNAVYENYSPQSIQNLKHSARFVLVVLLSMTIASFLFSKQKYDNLKENFHNIQDSQNRMKSITAINTATRFSCLINNGTVNRYRYGSGQDYSLFFNYQLKILDIMLYYYLAKMKSDLNENAEIMQNSQKNLSLVTYDFSNEYKDDINKQEIQLYQIQYQALQQNLLLLILNVYNVYEDVGNVQTVNIWSTIQQLAIQAYKIKDYY